MFRVKTLILAVVLSCLFVATSWAQTYYWAVNQSKAPFAWPGRTKAQTSALIQQAFDEFNRHSKLQIKPWSGKGPYHIVIAFNPKVAYNALATTESKNGKAYITVNSVRPVSDKAARSVALHEVFHQPLRYTASPAADKWGHSTDKNCAFNINASSDKLCPAEIKFLQQRYGKR